LAAAVKRLAIDADRSVRHAAEHEEGGSMKPSQYSSSRALLTLIVSLSLAACALIGGFNARSHEQVTALKAAHMKFIDTFTEGQGKSFNTTRLAEEADKIDLKFREAVEFSKSLDDKLRTSNIELLKEIFEEDLQNIRRNGRLLNAAQAKILSDPSADAYDRVVRGECARPGGRCK
jgi:hypothetical protein